MLENVVNNVYNGVYHVDITLFFYKDIAVKTPLIEGAHISNFLQKQSLMGGFRANDVHESPADLIIPISSFRNSKGYWFTIEGDSDVHYVSIHENDEF